MVRKSLSDILHGDDRDRLARQWQETEAAAEFGLLPKDSYDCHATNGTLETSRLKGTPSYRVEFTVCEGKFAGRKLWLDNWLTEAALPQSKRDLAKLGITSVDQLDRALPRGIRCKVRVAVRKNDDGTEYNKVVGFEVVGIDPPEPDPFAPAPAPSPNGQAPGDAVEPTGAVDTSFDPEALSAEGGTK